MDARLRAKIQVTFHAAEQSSAIELLATGCSDNLPLIAAQGEAGILRIRCAVVKLSQGSMTELKNAVHAAQADWRDVLVAAGFASDIGAHEKWLNHGSVD